MFRFGKSAGIAAMALAAVAVASGLAPAEGATGGKIKIHFVQGGGHNWKAQFPILERILVGTGDFEVTMSQDLNELRAENIKKYDVVLFYGSNQNFSDPEQEKGLCDFVRGGGGYAGIHSASDSFKKSDAYFELVGGRFAGHGGGKFKVYIHDKDHPITRGLEDFEIKDETYRHKYHKNACMRSLVRMGRGGERQSMGWLQDYGKGRMFYTSLGHGREAWTNPHFQRLAVRGIYWCVGREPKDPRTVERAIPVRSRPGQLTAPKPEASGAAPVLAADEPVSEADRPVELADAARAGADDRPPACAEPPAQSMAPACGRAGGCAGCPLTRTALP